MLKVDAMNPFSLISDKWVGLVKAGAVVLAVVLAVVWWSSHNAAQQQIGYDRAAGEYAADLAEAKEGALVTERAWRKKLEDATNARIEAEKQLALSRAAAAAADDRLRQSARDFRQRLSGATAEACRAAASAAAGLLEECSAAYRDVAAAAGGHLADLEQCEAAWPE